MHSKGSARARRSRAKAAAAAADKDLVAAVLERVATLCKTRAGARSEAELQDEFDEVSAEYVATYQEQKASAGEQPG